MPALLFVVVFGHLSGSATIDSREEDLYSVFLSRSELMGWYISSTRHNPLIWNMHEAELTAESDVSRIG